MELDQAHSEMHLMFKQSKVLITSFFHGAVDFIAPTSGVYI